ncbi:MAG: hypothetical protein QOF60_226 [Actinomycetota bacterium]|nr:hypothetical protein [Actinomycetota bacterium]
MRNRGRPVLGAIAGLFFGLFVALDLVFFKAIASGSPLLVILPVLGLVVGIAGALAASIGRAGGPPQP